MNADETQIASGYPTLLDLIPQCIAFRFETVLIEFSADGLHSLKRRGRLLNIDGTKTANALAVGQLVS
jgi:hypothetical protein